ncbi:MAG TPA: hypothetical protein PK886_00175 [Candidatus Paceibacterota bacterium]|nr:hypothetical protein [Candidatus Paceibacterota bacterium]
MKKDKKSLSEREQIALTYLLSLGIIPDNKIEYFQIALQKTSAYIEAYTKYKTQEARDNFRLLKYFGIYVIGLTIIVLLVNHFSSSDKAFMVSVFGVIPVITIFLIWIALLLCLLPLFIINLFMNSEKLNAFIKKIFRFIMNISKETEGLEKVAMELEKDVINIPAWNTEGEVFYEKLKKHYDALSKEHQKTFREYGETIAYIFDVTSAVIKNPANIMFIEHYMGIPHV